MLVVETVAKIRREHFRRGKGVKTIARELGRWGCRATRSARC